MAQSSIRMACLSAAMLSIFSQQVGRVKSVGFGDDALLVEVHGFEDPGGHELHVER